MPLYAPFFATLPDDPMVVELADALDLPDTQVLGTLACFWVWALNNRFEGYLDPVDWRAVERNARWTGKPKQLFEALVKVGFIEADGSESGYRIFNWEQFTEPIDRKSTERAGWRKRKQDQRKRDSSKPNETCHGDSHTGVTVTQEPMSRDVTPLTELNRTERNGTQETAAAGGDAPAHEDMTTGNAGPVPAAPVVKCYSLYGQNIALLTPIIRDEMSSLLDDGLEDDLICEAIREAAANNARNWRYIKSILHRCLTEGKTTLEQYRADARDRELSRARAAPAAGETQKTGGSRNGTVPFAAPNDEARLRYGI